MKKCKSCGMPLEKKEDFARGDRSSDYCVHCEGDEPKDEGPKDPSKGNLG